MIQIGQVARALVVVLATAGCAAAGSSTSFEVYSMGPGLQVRESTSHYTVRGSTPRQIQSSLMEEAPRHRGITAFGVTEWSLHWRFALRPTRDGCRAVEPRVRAEIEIILPRWRGEAEAGGLLAFRWGKFLRGVIDHEAGHRALVLEAGREIVERIRGATGPSCAIVRRTGEEVADRIVDRYERRHRQYDREADLETVREAQGSGGRSPGEPEG